MAQRVAAMHASISVRMMQTAESAAINVKSAKSVTRETAHATIPISIATAIGKTVVNLQKNAHATRAKNVHAGAVKVKTETKASAKTANSFAMKPDNSGANAQAACIPRQSPAMKPDFTSAVTRTAMTFQIIRKPAYLNATQ